MKILHIVPNYYPSRGGLQQLFQGFSEGLVRYCNDDVTVFTTNAFQSPHSPDMHRIRLREEVLNGVRIRRFSFIRHYTQAYKFIKRISKRLGVTLLGDDYLQLLSNGPISTAMFSAILNFKADIVVASSTSYLHMFYPIWARHLGNTIPFVQIGALHLENGLQVARPILRNIKNADAYIALTQFERDILVGSGLAASKIHIVNPGVDIEEMAMGDGQVVRERHGIGRTPVVAFIGRQAANKGIDILLAAMNRVWADYPYVFLLIAGAPGNFSPRLQQLVSQLSPNERQKVVLVNNFQESEKPHFFAAADVFVMVSKSESFGIAYLEAWACQKPVIGARIGAVESIIRDGYDGLLVSVNQVDQLAASILYLLRNASERVQLGSNGHKRVQSEHTWNAVALKLHEVYKATL